MRWMGIMAVDMSQPIALGSSASWYSECLLTLKTHEGYSTWFVCTYVIVNCIASVLDIICKRLFY